MYQSHTPGSDQPLQHRNQLEIELQKINDEENQRPVMGLPLDKEELNNFIFGINNG